MRMFREYNRAPKAYDGHHNQGVCMDVFDRWLQQTRGRNAEIRALVERGELYDRVCTRVRGRQIEVDGRWLTDFASCNYLGLDLHEGVFEAIEGAIKTWGTHPSWARMACSPALYEELERMLADKLGAEDAIVLPTISLIAVGLIPALVGAGDAILADRFVHKVNHDGCRLARDMRKADLLSFDHRDLEDLEAKLQATQERPQRLIVIDGVLSVTGRVPSLGEVLRLARAYDAMVYIDDAHGSGSWAATPRPSNPGAMAAAAPSLTSASPTTTSSTSPACPRRTPRWPRSSRVQRASRSRSSA